MEFTTPVLVAGAIALYGFIAKRLDGFYITGPMVLILAGIVLGPAGLGFLQIDFADDEVRLLAEIALVLVLFGDASRIDLGRLRREAIVPMRALLIGMPLAIALGTVLAYVLIPNIGWVVAAVIAVVLAPTDAALGQAVITNSSVPVGVRQTLNVESGLNDGLAAPVFALFIAAAAGEAAGGARLLELVGRHVGLGLVAGIAIGAGGGLLCRWAVEHEWTTKEWESIGAAAVAIASWSLAGLIGGNGFIAAFVGGMAWGGVARDDGESVNEFLEEEGQLLSLLVWLVFGAVLAGPMFSTLSWRVALYAVLSLVAVRMIAIAVSLIGVDLRWETTALFGWFGPRGLASVVFGLEAVGELEGSTGEVVLALVGATVLLSAFAHGISAAPLADWYVRKSEDRPDSALEEQKMVDFRTRPVTRMPAATEATQE